MKETLVVRVDGLTSVADSILQPLVRSKKKRASVVILRGGIGAGKTTLTQAIGEVLGVSEFVQSPTFTLRREYGCKHGFFKRLVHIDAYRFSDPLEAKVLRLEDDIDDKGTLIVIEWPERMDVFTADIMVDIKVLSEDVREMKIYDSDEK